MYESFFRFSERPFAVLPDSSRIFWTDGHRNAFSALEVGLDRLSQVTVLTGGIGTGKTTLIRHLLKTTSGAYSVGLLSNFAGDRCELLAWVLSAFGLDFSGSSEAVRFSRLEKFVEGELHRGRRSVLIVDEAQNLSVRDLESLRLLSNVNADSVLMMLILVGQPQLRAKLTHVDNQRLCQRIGADYHLEPLSREETAHFVRHRCVQAGGSSDLFEEEALDEVHRISGGVPRKINVLCDLALVSAYAEGIRKVEYRIVRSVVEDARRHGTYMSLTENDGVAVAGFGPEDQPASAVEGPSRDPAQRLALKLRSGDACVLGAETLGRRAADDLATAATSPEGAAPSAPADPAALNALFEMTWPDDTLMFFNDPAKEDASALSGERQATLPDGEDALDSTGHPPPEDAETVESALAPRRADDRDDGAIRQAPAAAAKSIFHRRSAAHHTSPAASALPASGAEQALRKAFASPPGWPRMGWRGATVAALAAGGSMAAGIAIALLPDGAPRSSLMDPAAEALLASPERIEGVAAASLPDVLAQAAAADPGPETAEAIGSAPQDGSLANSDAPDPERAPAFDGWARFSPAALAYENPRTDAMASPELGATASPMPAESGARPPAVVVADRGTSLVERSLADRQPSRIELPSGPDISDRPAETIPFVPSPQGGAGSSPSPRPADDAMTVAGPDPIPSAPKKVAASPGIHASHGTDLRSKAVALPAAESSLRDVSTASGVQTTRRTPGRPAVAALRTAAPRIPRAVELASAVSASGAPAAAPAETVPQAIAATNPSAEFDPETVFRDAVDIAIEDSRAAVVGYARAALMGHQRAAYYLGQIYETGDGVPVDFAIARHWYEAASGVNRRAQNRLADLPHPEGGDMIAPLPLLAQSLDAGLADFVWTSGEGADPISYVVEVSLDPGVGAVAAYPVDGSAARLPLVEGATHWRVLALDAKDGRSAASNWRAVLPAGSDRSAAADAPPDHL